MRQCIPFDVQPLPFRMPGSQPRRLRSLSARRVALSSPASVGQVVAPLQAPVRYRTSTDPWQPPRPPCSHPRNDKAHHDDWARGYVVLVSVPQEEEDADPRPL